MHPPPPPGFGKKEAAPKKPKEVKEDVGAGPCGCKSGKTYAECCQPFHKGKKYPQTPEALFRCRGLGHWAQLLILALLLAVFHPTTLSRDTLSEVLSVFEVSTGKF